MNTKTEKMSYLKRSCYISEVSNTATNDQHLSCKVRLGWDKLNLKSEFLNFIKFLFLNSGTTLIRQNGHQQKTSQMFRLRFLFCQMLLDVWLHFGWWIFNAVRLFIIIFIKGQIFVIILNERQSIKNKDIFPWAVFLKFTKGGFYLQRTLYIDY